MRLLSTLLFLLWACAACASPSTEAIAEASAEGQRPELRYYLIADT